MVERGLGFFISEQAEIMEGTGYLFDESLEVAGKVSWCVYALALSDLMLWKVAQRD